MPEPSHAVFLSYASEDAPAAARLCEALRAAGIEVWFDKSELRGGDAWDAAIRSQIKACALFVPIISASTHARVEGYFRLEWKLAVDRSHLIAPDQPFLLPVAIDDTPQSDPRVPERFRELQWTRLPGGSGSAAFVERVTALLAGASGPYGTSESATARAAVVERRRRPPRLLWAALAALVIAAGYFATERLALMRRAPPAANERSIAVLPFVDMSEKHDQEYFGDGLAEELLDRLAKTPGLQVIARTSSFAFKGRQATAGEIGRALGVATLLEGSVRKSGKHLRVTTQLVRTDTAAHLWSETYDRDEEDVFKLQADIARAVAERLRVTLLGNPSGERDPTTSPEAHDLYLQGRYLVAQDTSEGTARALDSFERAIAIDPDFAAAWAGISFARFRQAANGYAPVASSYDAAMEAARRAVRIDPSLPSGHNGVASVLAARNYDWAGSKAENDKALELDPNYSPSLFGSASLTMLIDGPEAAIPRFRRVLEVDPLNLLYKRYFARALFFAGRLEEAEENIRQVLQASPAFPAAHYELGRILLARGRTAEAVAAFEAEAGQSGWRSFGLPLAYHAAGRAAEAAAALAEQLRNPTGSEFQLAETYAFFGDTERAFHWLNEAVSRHDPGVLWVRGDAMFASLTADPRFAQVLARLKLQP